MTTNKDGEASSSEKNPHELVNEKNNQPELQYLEKSNYKELSHIELMGQKLGQKIISFEIEELKHAQDKINKLLIKYRTADGTEFYLKKNSDYDAKRVNKLMKLMNQEMPGKTNEIIDLGDLDDKELIVYKAMQGESLREKIITNDNLNEKFAVKSADLIYKFHSLDLNKFRDYLNDKNYSLKTVRFPADRDFVREIGQNNKHLASELDNLYQKLFNIEKEILEKSNLILIHGDFHPGNVLIDNGGDVKLIDYKNLTLGIKERDLASMFEQIYAQIQLGKHPLAEEVIVKWQETFLNSYQGEINKKN